MNKNIENNNTCNTKRRKNPDAPKRFRSPYIFFSSEKIGELKESILQTNPTGQDGLHVSFSYSTYSHNIEDMKLTHYIYCMLKKKKNKITDLSKLLSEKWRSLSMDEREIFEQRALEDKLRYKQEIRNFTGPMYLSPSPPSSQSGKKITCSNDTEKNGASSKRNSLDKKKKKKSKPTPQSKAGDCESSTQFQDTLKNKKPKRSMSAYLHWQKKIRSEFSAQNPQLTFGEISKALSKKWREISPEEREPHLEYERKARLVYNKESAEYKASLEKKRKLREENALREAIDMLEKENKEMATRMEELSKNTVEPQASWTSSTDHIQKKSKPFSPGLLLQRYESKIAQRTNYSYIDDTNTDDCRNSVKDVPCQMYFPEEVSFSPINTNVMTPILSKNVLKSLSDNSSIQSDTCELLEGKMSFFLFVCLFFLFLIKIDLFRTVINHP